MPQNYCHHINSAGVFYRGIPVKKRDYCYWHLHETGRRMKAARARARSQRVTMQMPVLDDLHAVQVGVMQVSEAVRHGEIDHPTGRLLLALLRLAASNIKCSKIWEQEAGEQDADLAGYVDEDPEFEEQYDLPENFDLSAEPEVVFPPVPQVRDLPLDANLGGPHIPAVGICGNDDSLRARFGQVLRDAATPIPGVDFQATADSMEVMDVFQREGEQASQQRAAQLKRNRKRREGRERRVDYEEMARNYSIQRAAQKMFTEWQRKAAAGGADTAEGLSAADTARKPPQSQGDSSFAEAVEVVGA
jgi:hypothetical protein